MISKVITEFNKAEKEYKIQNKLINNLINTYSHNKKNSIVTDHYGESLLNGFYNTLKKTIKSTLFKEIKNDLDYYIFEILLSNYVGNVVINNKKFIIKNKQDFIRFLKYKYN